MSPRGAGAPVGRRVILGLLGLGAVGVVTGAGIQRRLEQITAPIQSRDPTGLTNLFPDAGGFRFYSVTSTVPTRTAADYRLRVTGLVGRPATLTLDQLHAMPQTALTRDFQCVTGWRVSDVAWSGVRLAELLDAAHVQPGAQAVTIRSFDGVYTESLTLDQARRPDVLVALSMLGGPVTHDHGGPVRLYVAPMYGYKSLKWLGEIEVTDRVHPGYWEEDGYDVDAWVGHSNGRDDDATS
ncbi:molybdopterin-dependent oxidoreductase [Frankia sp. Cppng1_Ct_nod]|uniref:molybdopterin-dependent oxidoreductase n=1 Tax=Frankia sp. Cppng1_Ct_nod TaxID=2897162 RepID=UPI001040FF99|nr:molybdopterin-dependent oxidoreductase [Frankia sp. Cppng1_Ct_nod]